MNKTLATILITAIVSALLGFSLGYQYAITSPTTVHKVTSFDECVAAGFPVQESYPAVCGIPGGRSFVQQIDNGTLPMTTPGIDNEEGIACTLDAKICPDGSAVGRTPPNCEFAACPGE